MADQNRGGGTEDKFWLGKSQYPVVHLDRVDVGVAGIVAEEFADNHACDADQIMDYWEEEVITPSPTDLLMIPRERVRRLSLVQQAIRILDEHSELFNTVVSHLLEHELITPHDLQRYVLQPALCEHKKPAPKKGKK